MIVLHYIALCVVLTPGIPR